VSKPAAAAPRRGVSVVLVTLVLDAMGIGLILPVMPDLIRDVSGGDLAQAAVWGGVLATAYAVMQFLLAPLLGNLSDRHGRRPVLLVSLAVMALGYVAMALAPSFTAIGAGGGGAGFFLLTARIPFLIGIPVGDSEFTLGPRLSPQFIAGGAGGESAGAEGCRCGKRKCDGLFHLSLHWIR